MIHVAIVEDNKEEREKLVSYVDSFSKKNDIAIQTQAFEAAEPFLNSEENSFDVVLMDIELPGMNGMNACYSLRQKDKDIVIIFITNMASFAIKGYEVDALDFVLKPIREELFDVKFKKAVGKISAKKNDRISFSVNRTTKVFLLSDILYFEVLDHSLCIHAKYGEFNTRGSLNKLEEELQDKNFFRCNNYCLVNLRYVKEVMHDEIKVGEETIKLSRARKKDFNNSLCSYLGQS